jgi:hypothetical protein
MAHGIMVIVDASAADGTKPRTILSSPSTTRTVAEQAAREILAFIEKRFL